MARGIEGNEIATPRTQKPKAPPKSNNQKTLLGFFQKVPANAATDSTSSPTALKKEPSSFSTGALTPAPSSDAPIPSSSPPYHSETPAPKAIARGLPSPISPASSDIIADRNPPAAVDASTSSPSRGTKKRVNYAESDNDEADQDVFRPLSGNGGSGRSSKRRKVVEDDSEDDFEATADAADMAESEDAPEDSDEDVRPRKKKVTQKKASSAPDKMAIHVEPSYSPVNADDLEMPGTSTARQWTFDPENTERLKPEAAQLSSKSAHMKQNRKQKAHTSEPEKRYPWLANLLDADKNRPDHPDYDPRTVYIPPLAWANFSPFEKQYWEIKQKFWDTIVFFKKGKFYELYENDATIGHQLFDLKLTDRVNMRMVGVPEASLDMWANQFVAKGYKIARVDQMESALAKEMRERDDITKTPKQKAKEAKENKVIRRELAAVFTSGTLVDGGMLQNDMATYCVAIKETDVDNLPVFGIAFVDTATAQFHLANIIDDADMTKFETFVAQIRPGELLLEKSCLSSRAIRILKANTAPTTIWNWLKPDKEFWPGDITTREIDASAYFVAQGDQRDDSWPEALQQAKDNELVISSFGALTQYLRMLKIDRDLISLGNIQWYDPIRKATSLVLDGQSLINLEIFANSFDGSSEGTLFAMLNRCITPFGKRMLRQWVCHPLADSKRINERLDAVDALNANTSLSETFQASLSKLPDLERLISRIHAGRCKAQDFVKVLEGFEQIEYTMGILGALGGNEDGVVGQLIAAMPDLASALKHWESAFDRTKAKETGILVPEPGVEEDFDDSAANIANCEDALQQLLKEAQKELKSSAICFRDNGKEIYQLEVPTKIKSIPKSWDQMSATAKVKRYYSPELRKLVRDLQEARETHASIVKEVAGRFYARFDIDYTVWLAAAQIIAQLDCLISLSKASSALGQPSCRPTFVDSARPVQKFTDLRHPTMLTTVSDFIPNDISLGGTSPTIALLTGANAAGKSTVLRMTCIAVILAQLGCYVPCSSATLTPVDRIMSRLGANDNILQQQSTFFVELAETKKILSEATPRSLVILDELGRGTSSVDGLAVAEAVLHHIAGSVGCTGFFATHYHALASAFAHHPEVAPRRMAIEVDEAERRVTFLYRLEEGVAHGSFGMHCASMCGIPKQVVDRAEEAAREWEHSARVGEKIALSQASGRIGLGWLSDIAWCLRDGEMQQDDQVNERALNALVKAIEAM
ncbi:hypothetical protein FH972_021437 [Carpinus fangiana]|uniref:DNA mismatch repair protein n=1 Tax=Carpinus fangiana TaxID=176857 RepID=A0A5N6KPN7_9ROSI|nr:hypothetical protein FH972_021437 [Carpinus fangiana]